MTARQALRIRRRRCGRCGSAAWVAAVFMGENASVPDARTIYGHDLVRIQRMNQLAAAAGKLIQEEIRGIVRLIFRQLS